MASREPEPLVSVIMAARNVEKYIDDAFESVRIQTYKNWELIVIDDGSTDRTPEIIRSWTQKDPRIRSSYNIDCQGQALVRNEAVRLSKGAYLAILDADDKMLPKRLQTQVNFLEKYPEAALVGGQVEIIDEQGVITSKKRKPTNPQAIHFSLILQNQFIHSAVTIRRSAFETVGGYDNNFIYSEDYDLWCRMSDLYNLYNIDEFISQFRVSASSVTSMPKTQPVQLRNYLAVVVRNLKRYMPKSANEATAFRFFNYMNDRLTILGHIRTLLTFIHLSYSYLRSQKLTGDNHRQIRIIVHNHIKRTLLHIAQF